MSIRDDVEALIALLKTHKENTSQEYFDEIRSLDPVSYTHLDVYKRQRT